MAVTQLHDGNDSGVQIGSASTQKVGFHGATPVDRQTAGTAVATTAITAVATTAAVASSTAAFCYSTSTQANAIVTAINDLITRVEAIRSNDSSTRTALVNYGLIA